MSIKTIELDEAVEALADYLVDLDSGPVIVLKNGQPFAALTSLENTDLETASLSTSAQFAALIEQSRTRLRIEGGVSSAGTGGAYRLDDDGRAVD